VNVPAVDQYVTWEEPHYENRARVTAQLAARAADLQANAMLRADYLSFARDPRAYVHELRTQLVDVYPQTVRVRARVVSIAYQQEQVALSHKTVTVRAGLLGRTNVHSVREEARVRPAWKLLVQRVDNGAFVEMRPDEVTAELP
jgi:hypothetical protein